MAVSKLLCELSSLPAAQVSILLKYVLIAVGIVSNSTILTTPSITEYGTSITGRIADVPVACPKFLPLVAPLILVAPPDEWVVSNQ